MLTFELLYRYPDTVSGIAIIENDEYSLLLIDHPEENVSHKNFKDKLEEISRSVSCTFDLKATSYFFKRFFGITLKKCVDVVTISAMLGTNDKFQLPVHEQISVIKKASMYGEREGQFVRFPRPVLEAHYKTRLVQIRDVISRHLKGSDSPIDLAQYIKHFIPVSAAVGILEASAFAVEGNLRNNMLQDETLKNHWSKLQSLKDINHCAYSIDSASTGRLSSGSKYGSVFNALAIPKDIRECIVPQNDFFVELDYSSFEFNVLLHLFGPEKLIDKLSDVYNTICEEAKIDDRDIVKSIVFKKIYGIGGVISDFETKKALNENNIGESKVYVFNKYLDWVDDVKDSIQQLVTSSKERSLVNGFGRKINFSKEEVERKNLLFNNLIQSTAADIALSALSKIQEYLIDRNSKLILFCHDSFLIDMSIREREIINNIRNILENILKGYKLPVSITIGKNYGTMRKLNV